MTTWIAIRVVCCLDCKWKKDDPFKRQLNFLLKLIFKIYVCFWQIGETEKACALADRPN